MPRPTAHLPAISRRRRLRDTLAHTDTLIAYFIENITNGDAGRGRSDRGPGPALPPACALKKPSPQLPHAKSSATILTSVHITPYRESPQVNVHTSGLIIYTRDAADNSSLMNFTHLCTNLIT